MTLSYNTYKSREDLIQDIKKEFNAIGLSKKGKVVKVSDHQTGSSIRSIDVKRSAMPSGKRMSRFGKIYYEYRKNRSDMKGRV